MGCAQSVLTTTFDDPVGGGQQQQQVAALQQQVADLQAKLASAGGHGGGGGGGGGTYEVLWFPDTAGMPCRNGANCHRQNCTYAHTATSLSRLLMWLDSAKVSLEICVFNITCNEIADAVLAAHRRGVAVRIITDNDQSTSQGSDVQRLAQSGIPVRMDKDSYHMHHKWAIVDQRFVLNGSFNWTRQAVLNNQENVVIMDHPGMAATFHQHFELLWRKFA